MAAKKHPKPSSSPKQNKQANLSHYAGTAVLAASLPLEKIDHIDWLKMGLFHHDLVGWEFSKILNQETDQAKSDYDQLGLVIHCPVDIRIQDGNAYWEPKQTVQDGPFQIEKNWQSIVEIQEKRLIFHLPLKTLHNQGAMMIPAPEFEGGPKPLEIITTSHQNDHPELLVILPLPREGLTLRRGIPLAHLVPIPNPEQQFSAPEASTDPSEISHQPETVSESSQSDLIPIEPTAPPPFQMRVWRVHPEGVRINRATKDLRGDAPYGAMKFCGPFTHANSYGYWIYSPIDVDIIWHGGRSFDYKIINDYNEKDLDLIRSLERPEDQYHYTHSPRNRIDFGTVSDNIATIWTGCIFQTPPGWGLMIRNPVNVKGETIFRVQEGILETDWLSYDIWMNLEFLQQDKWVHLRREKMWPPIAQLVPVPRKAYDEQWHFEERLMERTTPEGSNMYERWCQYNYKKWLANSQKDSTTYNRMRAKTIPTLNHPI